MYHVWVLNYASKHAQIEWHEDLYEEIRLMEFLVKVVH